MRRRSFLSAVAGVCLLGSAFGTTGCNSTPTLPLPPPVVDVGSPNEQGLVTVRGEVLPLAYVSVFNERTESGLIVRADGEGDFEVELEAEVGDLISVWSEIDGEQSERKRASVPPPR